MKRASNGGLEMWNSSTKVGKLSECSWQLLEIE